MKKIIIIFTFLTSALYSQHPIYPLRTNIDEIEKNSYIKDLKNELNPFVGTWTYENNHQEITVNIQKIMTYDKWADYYDDVLNANYSIAQADGIQYNSLSTAIENADIKGIILDNENNYLLTYYDKTNCNITGTVKIWLDAKNPNLLHWQMELDHVGIIFLDECPQANKDDFGLSLPLEMTLQRATEITIDE